MPEDVNSVTDAKNSAQIPVELVKPLSPSLSMGTPRDNGLGTFHGMAFVLPIAVAFWLTIGMLVWWI